MNFIFRNGKKVFVFLGGSSTSSQQIACLTAKTKGCTNEKLNPEGSDSSEESSDSALSPADKGGGVEEVPAGSADD